ncbi:MAG TPA: hypothetical protein VK859_14250, partial [bacterium]|nr:hypothetical protein [bacterium]
MNSSLLFSGLVLSLLSTGCATIQHSQEVYYPPVPMLHPEPVTVATQRYDNQRTGADLAEYVLTVEALRSGQFQKLYGVPVDGQIYAQPLYLPQVKWMDGSLKNILIVATMRDWVYAFQVDDAFRGKPSAPQLMWKHQIGEPLPPDFLPMAGTAVLYTL